MSFADGLRALRDFTRRNEYALKKYVIQDGKKHPFALICPGGGYGMVCSFLEGRPYALELKKRGYSAFVLYYHVREKAKYPAPQQDVACALQEIMSKAEEWNLETEGYSIWGSSAGGHLAASFGTNAMGYSNYHLPRPGALVLSYPVVTMGGLTHQDSCDNLLGKNPTKEQITLASVEQQITPEYPPTFVWCGLADSTVDPANSKMLVDALASHGITHLHKEYPGVEHGVGLGKGLACEPWFEEAVAFWERQRRR